MNIVTIDSAFIAARLNALPPHSRLRSGYIDILRHMRKQQLAIEAAHRDRSAMEAETRLTIMLVDAVSDALAEAF